MSQDGGQGRYAGRALAGGRYQLRDLLGEGGMASVHLAYDSVLDRQVAIKTLHTELGREQAFRERFRREAQAVAKLTHTNIVSVFDTGEDDLDGMTTPYIVMEYVEGRPLGSVLDEDVRQQGAMPADKALKITADVLAALEISHEMGLVHRDIKPGNVMMTKRGVVKVMDFGIARAMQSGVTSMTQTGMVVGTPQYLSPEQALGRGVDARSDLYSVGIMLFQLVTGRLPFDADSPLAIAYAHVQEQPVAPSAVNRALPPAVDALVARALKKNPNERFPPASVQDAGAGDVPVGTGRLPVRRGRSVHGVGSGPSLVSSYQPVPSVQVRNQSARLGASTYQAWSTSPALGSKRRTVACGVRQSTHAYIAQPQWDMGRTPSGQGQSGSFAPLSRLARYWATAAGSPEGSWSSSGNRPYSGPNPPSPMRRYSSVSRAGRGKPRAASARAGASPSTGSGRELQPHGRVLRALAATLSSNCSLSVMDS